MEYTLVKKSGKTSAEAVRKIPTGTIPGVEVKHSGLIVVVVILVIVVVIHLVDWNYSWCRGKNSGLLIVVVVILLVD